VAGRQQLGSPPGFGIEKSRRSPMDFQSLENRSVKPVVLKVVRPLGHKRQVRRRRTGERRG
jgi:hypothetical protein